MAVTDGWQWLPGLLTARELRAPRTTAVFPNVMAMAILWLSRLDFHRGGAGMSTFENDRYRWRETYFLLFDSAKRPAMEQVQKLLKKVNRQFEIHNPRVDDDDGFESVTVLAPSAYAALDISYVDGEEVQEQTVELCREFRDSAASPDERVKLDR